MVGAEVVFTEQPAGSCHSASLLEELMHMEEHVELRNRRFEQPLIDRPFCKGQSKS